jgi:GNAT superfamily N-acetyltransferase
MTATTLDAALVAELDNPFHTSLTTRHRSLALGSERAWAFPSEFAPFLGVPDADSASPQDLAALLAPGETRLLIGVAPHARTGLELEVFNPLAQMVAERELELPDGPEILALDSSHLADVLALTALVYPHYFRPRTMELGRYFGVYVDGRLAAMIGERMGSERTQEISAVCTHPDFNGRGYARRLLAFLSNDVRARGLLPYLHVSHANDRAYSLYLQMGYRLRADVGFYSLRATQFQ